MENDDSSVIYKLIDENLLIDLVKCRPVLWDLSEGNYRKKTSCDQAWEEVYKDLFPNYHCFEGERKIALTKEVKRKWTNLRDAYNKTRKAGKESISKYKVLDFLAKVYDEKEKKGTVFISPVKEKNSPLDDSDADTQLNTTLQKRERAPASSILQQNCVKHVVNVKSVSSRNISEENDTQLILLDRAPAQQGAKLHPADHESNKADSVAEDDIAVCDSLISDAKNEDMRVMDETPLCTTTFIKKNSAKCRVCSVPRSGVKRRLDQTEGEKGKFYYFLQFLKNEYASKEKFDSSRSKRLKTEILHLMDSVSSDFDDDQTEEFNFKAIKFLLAMKSWTEDEEKEGDLKKKWTKMRDQFKKCWLEGKTFYYNGCKIENDKLNFLIPVFEEKTSKKQQTSHSRLDMILNKPGPSKAPQEPPDIGEDDDTETVLNYNLRDFGSSNIFEHELSRNSTDNNYQIETVNEQPSSTNNRISSFVANNKGIITVLKASKTSDIAGGLSDHEEEVSEKVRQLPPPHTIAPEPPEIQSSSGSHFQDEYLVKTTPDQSNAKGTKRLKLYDTEINCQKEQGTKRPHLDDTEIKKQGFLNYIEGSTEKFNHTQNTNFCIEISSLLKLYLDKGTTLSNDELSDFNSRALRVLLSTLTNCYDQVIDILQTILNTENLFELLGHSNCCKKISSLLPSYLGRGTTLSNQDLSDFNSRVLRVLLSTVTNLDSDKLDIIIMNIVKESMKEGKNV